MIKEIQNKIMDMFRQEIEVKRQSLEEESQDKMRKVQNEVEHKGEKVDVYI
jgi:hypothetical protein